MRNPGLEPKWLPILALRFDPPEIQTYAKYEALCDFLRQISLRQTALHLRSRYYARKGAFHLFLFYDSFAMLMDGIEPPLAIRDLAFTTCPAATRVSSA